MVHCLIKTCFILKIDDLCYEIYFGKLKDSNAILIHIHYYYNINYDLLTNDNIIDYRH